MKVRNLTESINKKYRLHEKKWTHTLSSGTELRNKINAGDAMGVLDCIEDCYGELLDKGFIDDYDYESAIEDFELYDAEDDNIEENVDYELDNLYDLCDYLGVWIPIFECFISKKNGKSRTLNESYSNSGITLDKMNEDWWDEEDGDKYSLVGQDGNAFALMGYTGRCMRECGLGDEIKEMQNRAMSGDYNNLICVCDEYVQKCNKIARDSDWLDESWDNGPYLYFTKHGIGPGTIPNDVSLNKVIDMDNFVTAMYLSRPLTKEELDYYDIIPEWSDRHKQYEKELEKQGGVNEDYTFSNDTNDYRLLSRMKSDCDYYLNTSKHPKHLWAGDEQAQINKMKEIWNNLKEKPEWLSMEDINDYAQRMGVNESYNKEVFTICKVGDHEFALGKGNPPIINARKIIEADSYDEAKEILMNNGYSESELVFESKKLKRNKKPLFESYKSRKPLKEDYWLIIPSENRYDEPIDIFKFARKYGVFTSQADADAEIERLAPDRWDAFITYRLIEESLNKKPLKENVNELDIDSLTFDELLDLWWEMNGMAVCGEWCMQPEEIDAYWKDKPDDLLYDVREGLPFYDDEFITDWMRENGKLIESVNQKDVLTAVKDMYGYTTKEAKEFINKADKKTLEEIVNSFKGDAKRSFLADSFKLNESKEIIESEEELSDFIQSEVEDAIQNVFDTFETDISWGDISGDINSFVYSITNAFMRG